MGCARGSRESGEGHCVTIGSLFSGGGGLDLGLERAGLGPVIWNCESDPFCRAVLAKHWPGVRSYHDVREIDEAAERPDVLCGGPPCQPVSVAGKQRGQADERWLWPEFLRVARALRPRAIVIENVAHGRGAWLPIVLADLEAADYHAHPLVVRADDLGAPHERGRVFVLAHADREPIRKLSEWGPARWTRLLQRTRQAQSVEHGTTGGWRPLGSLLRADDGIPRQLDRHRFRVVGNAVSPQVAEFVGLAFREAMGL